MKTTVITADVIRKKRKEIKSFKATVAAVVVFLIILAVSTVMAGCSATRWADSNAERRENIAHALNYEIWPETERAADSLEAVIASEKMEGR